LKKINFYEERKMSKKTFARMMQVGIVVRDMDTAIKRLSELGIGPFEPKLLPEDAKETYRGKPFFPAKRVKIQAARIGNMELELIQPLEGGSPHREFLEKYGEGMQHLGFFVDDLKSDVEELKKKDCEVLLTSEFKNGGGVTYLDLGAGGLIVELVQPK
jgi:methylmalonyl-CoA/ethylmalonyl-CoA epimerase